MVVVESGGERDFQGGIDEVLGHQQALYALAFAFVFLSELVRHTRVQKGLVDVHLRNQAHFSQGEHPLIHANPVAKAEFLSLFCLVLRVERHVLLRTGHFRNGSSHCRLFPLTLPRFYFFNVCWVHVDFSGTAGTLLREF